MEKQLESESIKHHQNIQTTSILSISDNEKNNLSKITTTTTTNHRSLTTAVNHLGSEEQEEEEEKEIVVISPTNPLVKHSPRNSKTTQQSVDKNIANINNGQITDGEEEEEKDRYQQMSSDEESDNDLELFQTLAQLHDLVHPSRLSSDIHGTDASEQKPCSLREEDDKFSHLRSNLNEEKKPNILFTSTDNDRNSESNVEQNSSLTSSELSHVDEVHILHSDTSLNLSDSKLFGQDHFLRRENQSSCVTSCDLAIVPVVERLVSDTLQSTIDQINPSSSPVDHFIEQILSEAVYEIYTENSLSNSSKFDHSSSMDNLLAIMNWHYQSNRQVLDPFDQRFDSVWISHFQTPDDHLTEHEIDIIDPFHITITNGDSMKSIRSMATDDLSRSKVISKRRIS